MERKNPDERSTPRPAVLLVDDDPEFAAEMEAVLSDECDVLLERDSEGALSCVRRTGIDVAIVDLDLPPFLGRSSWDEGLILIRLLAREHHVPVVVVTNSDDEVLLGEAAGAGAIAIQGKQNLRPERLHSLVRNYSRRLSR